jgi:hypothetical protein
MERELIYFSTADPRYITVSERTPRRAVEGTEHFVETGAYPV